MAKAGMKRPSPDESYSTQSNKKNKQNKNKEQSVPEIEGKAKSGHEKAGKI